jgi:hypothetical protein
MSATFIMPYARRGTVEGKAIGEIDKREIGGGRLLSLGDLF